MLSRSQQMVSGLPNSVVVMKSPLLAISDSCPTNSHDRMNTRSTSRSKVRWSVRRDCQRHSGRACRRRLTMLLVMVRPLGDDCGGHGGGMRVVRVDEEARVHAHRPIGESVKNGPVLLDDEQGHFSSQPRQCPGEDIDHARREALAWLIEQ